MRITDRNFQEKSNCIYFKQAFKLPEQHYDFCVLPCVSLKEQSKFFKEFLPKAKERGITLLIQTCGEASDIGLLKRFFSCMKGAGICWDIAATVAASEPPRTTIKSLFLSIHAVIVPSSEIGKNTAELLRSQNYTGIFCFPEV